MRIFFPRQTPQRFIKFATSYMWEHHTENLRMSVVTWESREFEVDFTAPQDIA